MPPVPFVPALPPLPPAPARAAAAATRRRDPRRRCFRRARRCRRLPPLRPRRCRRSRRRCRPLRTGRRGPSRRRRCPRSRRPLPLSPPLPAVPVASPSPPGPRRPSRPRCRCCRRRRSRPPLPRRRSVRRCFPRSPHPWPAAGRRTRPVTATSPNFTSARPRFRRPREPRRGAARWAAAPGLKWGRAWVKVEEGVTTGMQFDKVEGPGPAAPPACAQCSRPLDEYFALGGHMFCRTCVDGFRAGASFWRALLYGAGAAVAGNDRVVRDPQAVQLRAGHHRDRRRPVRRHRGAQRGPRPRWLEVPGARDGADLRVDHGQLRSAGAEEHGGRGGQGREKTKTSLRRRPANEGAPRRAARSDRGEEAAAGIAGGRVRVLVVFAIALAMPFLAGAGNFMGWIIIGIALYEAWKLNRRLPITGPLRFGGGLSVPAPAPVTPPGMPPPAAAT